MTTQNLETLEEKVVNKVDNTLNIIHPKFTMAM